MDINIRLNKNFTVAFNKMLNEYGEEIAKLNGFSDEQLSYTDFIDNFVDKQTVADASVDGNANVGVKDICSLMSEMSKPHSKLLAFNKIFYELNKKYGFKTANEWLRKEWDGHFYLHDAYSSTYVPYSYKGTETVVVKYKEKTHLIPFGDLYDLVEENEQILSEKDEAYCKYTNHLYVWDKDNTWSKVLRVIRKPKTVQFHFIKANNGVSEIVTSNHPVITTESDIEAKDITENHVLITQQYDGEFGNIDTIYCAEELIDTLDKPMTLRGIYINNNLDLRSSGQVSYFKGTNPIQNIIKLDYDFGWFIGMVIADGFKENDCISIRQNQGSIFDNIVRILEEKNYGYIIYNINEKCQRIKIRSQVLSDLVYKCFVVGKYSKNIHLKSDILKYNKTFIKGIVAGILDGDGTWTEAQGRRIYIRTTSRSLMNQLSFIIRMFGYTVREQTPSICRENKFIKQKNYIYHLTFTPYNNVENFDSIKIKEHNVGYTSKLEEGRYTNGKYTLGFGEKNVSSNIVLEYDDDNFVYDISVETGHFMCNNILSHNCFAYDIENLVTKGLYFIDNFNAQPPKHLVTYTDFVGEFVSWVSNRSSGACGLPSFLIYSYYFWKKDVENGYYTGTPERYRDQEFQRIIYKLNQPYLRINQSAFTNFSIFDHEYMETIFGGKEFPDGTFIIDYIDDLIEYQKRFMEVVSEIRSKNMMTFPVLSFSLLRKNGKFVDEEFAKWCCKHNMKWADSNFFVSEDITSLSNCCRLISDVKNLGYFNSIGSTALEVGSVKVNTINLARIAYENDTRENYLLSLKELVILNLQALDCVREIIRRNIEKGLLPNYTKEIMSMDSQYNTIGIIGVYEALQKFGYTYKDKFGNTFYSDKGIEFAKEILKVITDTKNEFGSDKEYQINIEEVPAERAAAILMEKDKFFYPNELYELPLYGNQWIPLGVKTTLQEKIRLSAILDKACSGGSIAHINLDAPLNDFETAWDLLNYVADQGVVYFAFCLRISSCKNNHGFYGNICPYCGEEVKTTWQRVVGFLTPEITYSKERKLEFSKRDWLDIERMREIG